MLFKNRPQGLTHAHCHSRPPLSVSFLHASIPGYAPIRTRKPKNQALAKSYTLCGPCSQKKSPGLSSGTEEQYELKGWPQLPRKWKRENKDHQDKVIACIRAIVEARKLEHHYPQALKVKYKGS